MIIRDKDKIIGITIVWESNHVIRSRTGVCTRSFRECASSFLRRPRASDSVCYSTLSIHPAPVSPSGMLSFRSWAIVLNLGQIPDGANLPRCLSGLSLLLYYSLRFPCSLTLSHRRESTTCNEKTAMLLEGRLLVITLDRAEQRSMIGRRLSNSLQSPRSLVVHLTERSTRCLITRKRESNQHLEQGKWENREQRGQNERE